MIPGRLKNTTLMRKRLVFSFYVSEDWEESFSNRVHLAYLEHYHDVYDSAFFIVICDDVNDIGLISGFEKRIVDIGFTSVEFKVTENTLLREAKPFYEEIVLKMKEFDGIVTWGHNKGVSSVYFYHEGIFNWISAMYYGTMGLMDDCEKKMVSNYYGGERYFYGAPLVEGNGKEIPWIYSGTFFNMNPASIVRVMKVEGMEFPKLSNRAYAEMFPGSLFGYERMGSYKDSYLFHKFSDFYEYSPEDWDIAFKIIFNDEFDKFKELMEHIWKGKRL